MYMLIMDENQRCEVYLRSEINANVWKRDVSGWYLLEQRGLSI